MKCPVCSTPDLLMTERQGVEIDYCPICRGVWLDRGELDKLIERTDGSATMPAHLTRNGDRSDRGDRGERRDGDERGQHIEREYRKESQGHGFGHSGEQRRDAHSGHDDRRRHYDQPRKKKSLFEMFDFD